MSNTIGNSSTPPGEHTWRMNISWVEGTCFFLLVMLISFLYGMPQYLSGRISWFSLLETLLDCVFMTVAALPAWWLHFRMGARWQLKWRLSLHSFTILVYYGNWLLCYVVYNPIAGHPVMTPWQVLYNAGPNILFYLQLFSFLHIYHFFREREAQLKREQELASLAYNSEIQALKAQIQPHFLFNTLNSISASVPPEQETTRELIAQLADTFRYALYVSRNEWVALEEEATFIRTMLELEHRRFGKRLQYEITPLGELASLIVPSMLLQPLVENAIRHGVAPQVEGGKITVAFERHGQRLKVSVSDTGNGHQAAREQMLNSDGVGLKNVRRRLELLFKETINIEKNEPKGLIFYFFIPAQYHVNQNRTYHRRRRSLAEPDTAVSFRPPHVADPG
ncbi:histidine kinase [Chitinophaga horti]|uniref:Histidine kinase n=1 Tax=Chitinophaga horti TaxID=2920382 RepID=A0ABY6J906_9BACT|nr:histidine kinase [Chitinophaga horti]UYQ94802.1 histidine kinase [Chitinophaga horti]